jgi:hypothetical protein
MADVTPSGSGGPIQLTGPAVDGALEIRGGVGGISFQLEELMGGAEKLDGLARELAAVEADVHHIWQELCPYQNEPRATGTAALVGVGEAQWSVQAVRTELQRISQQVRDSKRDYELAEVAAGLARGLGLAGPGIWARQILDLRLAPFLNRESVEFMTGNVPATLGMLLGVPGEVIGAIAAEHAARTHIGAAVPLVRSVAENYPDRLKPRPVTFKQQESLPIELTTSPTGLLERARLINERGDGYVEIIEVDKAGEKAYVVVLPGTQPGKQAGGGPGGDNPFDEAGIAEGLGYGSAEVNAAVLGALRAAGAEKGAPVVAVGYSQGGIHAMNLAADELFGAGYDVKYVLTAGSPVGSIPPGAGVSTLHLEHRQDWVPGADGTPSPDARNRVTVTLTNEVRTPDEEDAGLGPGHRLGNYQEGARLVETSEDPSLVASVAVLGSVLGAGGKATATRFVLSRTKPPGTQPAPDRVSDAGRPGPVPQQGK